MKRIIKMMEKAVGAPNPKDKPGSIISAIGGLVLMVLITYAVLSVSPETVQKLQDKIIIAYCASIIAIILSACLFLSGTMVMVVNMRHKNKSTFS